MAIHVKKGDMVEVICGDHKGSKGKVMKITADGNRVVIEGINLAHKHVRPSQRNPQGGVIRVEQPVHISNVLPVNPKTSKGTRVRFAIGADGSKKRVGLDGTEIGVLKRTKKK